MVWSRFVGKEPQKTIETLPSNPLQMEWKNPVWNWDTTSYLKLLLICSKYFASFSNTSNLSLTLLLNKDMICKDFPDFVKKLFWRSSPLIDILNLLFLKLWAAFLHVKLEKIKFLHVNNMWDFTLFIQQNVSDKT